MDAIHDADMIAADARWRARDLDVLWHPCTQMREHPHTLPLVPIARGEGAWLVGQDGRRYLVSVMSNIPYTTSNVDLFEVVVAAVFAARGDLA